MTDDNTDKPATGKVTLTAKRPTCGNCATLTDQLAAARATYSTCSTALQEIGAIPAFWGLTGQHVSALPGAVRKLAAERDVLQDRVAHQPNIQCVFCGHLERCEGSATEQVNQIIAHMLTCELHPMRRVEEQRDRLQKRYNRLRRKVVRISADRNATRVRLQLEEMRP